ncbi:MAG: rhomboid family intramembrane serine protease [Bacteroidia bacterium]|nr:rhomboid family intramembrane serine protease [Bacteroidia bacterium]
MTTATKHFKPLARNPFYLLSGICVVLFLAVKILSLFSWSSFLSYFFLPLSIERMLYQPWAYLTAPLMHTDFLHLISNLLFLYIFYGTYQTFGFEGRFLRHFFLGGAISFFVVQVLFLFIDHHPISFLTGASASAFFMGTFLAFRFPDYRIHLMFLPPVKLKYFIVFWLVLTVMLSSVQNLPGTLSHFCGMLCGTAFYYFRFRFRMIWIQLQKKIPEAHHGNHTPSENPLEKTLNALLDKINEKGFESLTNAEKKALEELSEKLKRKN